MDTQIKKLEIQGTVYTVHELTVRQVRDWFNSALTRTPDVVNDGLFEAFSLNDLARMYSVEPSGFDDLAPSQVEGLAKLAQEVNPHFFTLLSRLADIGRASRSTAP